MNSQPTIASPTLTYSLDVVRALDPDHVMAASNLTGNRTKYKRNLLLGNP